MKDKSLLSRTTTKLHGSKRGLIDLTIFFKSKILERFFSNTMVAAVSVEDLGSLRNWLLKTKKVFDEITSIHFLSWIPFAFNSSLSEIQDGGMDGGQKGPPTSFSLVTSTNVGIRHKNFLNFNFNTFDTLM